ncbi:uracil-DNA glycosylase family protein [Citromicrobium bathyomarinum]|uniref:uracil-DNA glycosylase family protein n=1 Tax=Citromicrobium bathyomarinum TaxID=72174 RepID=UPI00315A8EF0
MSTRELHRQIAACRVCEAALGFEPRPVAQFSATSRILIVGQAPGSKVHASGIPWDDASGERLCEWTGLTRDQLHDPALVAIVPMGFCYPGKASGGDKPPRPECAPLWHERVLATLPQDRLTLLVGTYAQKRYLPETRNARMADRVADWRSFGDTIPLPHPSWRSTMFMRKHPWFEAELVPEVRRRVREALA